MFVQRATTRFGQTRSLLTSEGGKTDGLPALTLPYPPILGWRCCVALCALVLQRSRNTGLSL